MRSIPRAARPFSFALIFLALVACGSSGGTASDAGEDGSVVGTGGDSGGGVDASGPTQDATVGDTGAPSDGGPKDGSASGDAATSDAGDAGNGSDAAFVMAPHPPLPVLINQNAPGLGVLTAPQVVTVTFKDDPYVAAFQELGQGIASSAWWDQVIGGFCDGVGGDGGPCIGHGPAGVSAVLPFAPNATYTDPQFQQLLVDQINAGVLPAPELGSISQSLYVVYFPQTSSVNGGCSSFFGYHESFTFTPKDGGPAQTVPCAVVEECEAVLADGGFDDAGTLAYATETASHEIMEAATDTDFFGFYLNVLGPGPVDPNVLGWNNVLGGEVGDLCDWFGPPPYYDFFAAENVQYGSTPLILQRIWSNPQAAAGLDPCLPIPPGVVFFEVAPQPQYVVLDVGGSATIDGLAFSTAPTEAWSVDLLDFSGSSPDGGSYLQLSMDGPGVDGGTTATGVNNGDVLKVHVTLLDDPGSSPNGSATGVLLSYAGPASNPTAAYLWPFTVMTPADALDGGLDAAVTPRPAPRGSSHGPQWLRAGRR
jgi:hypothetical protein